MANKRNRRTASGGASGGGTTTRDATIVRPAPAAPGGPNRQARKQEARRQREAIHKRMARRRIMQRVAIVLAVVLVAGAVGAYFVLRTSPAEAAGCGSVRTISPYDPSSEDRSHIGNADVPTTPPLSTYASTPAVSGPHDPSPQASGTYDAPPDAYRTIHSLEHAGVVIWYNPSVTGSELDALKAYFQDPLHQDHVIVAPYSYPDQGTAGSLPSGKDMVMVAWHHIQSCNNVSLDAATSFVGGYRYNPERPTDYQGDAPEPGSAM